jgi:hypothetical protein
MSQEHDALLIVLLCLDLLLFSGGAIAHQHIPIPLGFTTWVEPLVLPASLIEGFGAVILLFALAARVRHAPFARRLTWWALWYCLAGVLWGMARLAMGSIPEAHTMTNDFLHIGMTVVTTVALVRLAGQRL